MVYHFPFECYSLLNNASDLVFLETCRFDRENYRSWLFVNPLTVLRIYCISELPKLFSEIEAYLSRQYYLAGYFSYECGYHFENITEPHQSPKPLAWFGVYPAPLVFNHYTGSWENGFPGSASLGSGQPLTKGFTVNNPELSLPAAVYQQKIDRIKEYILAGDVYQVNFTGKYHFEFEGSASALYHFLRAKQQVSYAAYLKADDLTILSYSPELFFRREDSLIMTKPMKGTAPRGKTLEEDFLLAEQLRRDSKNQAENLMIVDLLRNDLGRIAATGSVKVPEIFTIEKYQTLLQMTSTITATLPPEVSYYEIFRSLFPCGSVTGAPKIRAMQIIHELETGPRGIYTGAIGYFAPDRRAVFNVPIRTLVLNDNQGEMGVGNGVVFDSDPESEYQECTLKANFFTVKQPEFQLIETMLWNQGYPFLDKHLNRLQQSAEYFDYFLDLDELNSRINEVTYSFQPGQIYKVRLTLSRSGQINITSAEIAKQKQPVNLYVTLSDVQTDSRDLFLYHKTTNRLFYDRMYREAVQKGLADVIFMNERQEITEGAISNVLIEWNGYFVTPPVTCGLLNGVYRSHLIDTLPNIVEQVITENDFRNADGIYICNALRGLRKVTVKNIIRLG
jgi:para-aminobenzoate synthetase/4-amino-4-deoxychorismate lyase